MLADLEPSGEGEQGRHLVSKPGETSCLDCSMRGRFGVLALDRQFLTSADAVRGDIHFAAELSLQRIAANVIACRGWHGMWQSRAAWAAGFPPPIGDRSPGASDAGMFCMICSCRQEDGPSRKSLRAALRIKISELSHRPHCEFLS